MVGGQIFVHADVRSVIIDDTVRVSQCGFLPTCIQLRMPCGLLSIDYGLGC